MKLYTKIWLEVLKNGSALRALKKTRLRPLFSTAKNYFWQLHQISKQNEGPTRHPTSIHLEITTYCPRNCQGCYVPQSERSDKRIMDVDTAREVMRIGRKNSIRIYNLIGGEPLTKQTVPLIRTLAKENKEFIFHICSNSYFLSERTDQTTQLIRLPNITIGMSVDGFQTTNDSIRGAGSFKRMEMAAEYLASNRCFFGALITLREANKDEVLTPQFIDFLISKGFLYAYFLVSDDSLIPHLDHLKQFGFEKPIFITNEIWGTLDATSKSNRPRTSYVNRDGKMLKQRCFGREMIGTIGLGLEAYANDTEWVDYYKD